MTGVNVLGAMLFGALCVEALRTLLLTICQLVNKIRRQKAYERRVQARVEKDRRHELFRRNLREIER